MIMAMFKYLSIFPAALRIGLAGGAAYGTVRAGVWSDSSKSGEKLERIEQATRKVLLYPIFRSDERRVSEIIKLL